MSTSLIFALIFNGALLSSCAFALLRGGRPERIGAVINLVGCLGTAALRATSIRYFMPGEPFDMAVDLAVVVSFFLLAVRSARFWPIWAFGFALGDVFMVLGGAILPKLPIIPYQSALGLYSYLALIAMTLGTWRLSRIGDGAEQQEQRSSSA